MFKRTVAVLREQHIGEVMCGVFMLFALESFADAVNAPFLNLVVRFFNAHTTQFPAFEPHVSGVTVALKCADVVIFSALAWVFYCLLRRNVKGDSRG